MILNFNYLYFLYDLNLIILFSYKIFFSYMICNLYMFPFYNINKKKQIVQGKTTIGN